MASACLEGTPSPSNLLTCISSNSSCAFFQPTKTKHHLLIEIYKLTNARVSTRNALLMLGFESSHVKRTWPRTGANATLSPLFLQAPWVKRVRPNLLQTIEDDMVEIRQANEYCAFFLSTT